MDFTENGKSNQLHTATFADYLLFLFLFVNNYPASTLGLKILPVGCFKVKKFKYLHKNELFGSELISVNNF